MSPSSRTPTVREGVVPIATRKIKNPLPHGRGSEYRIMPGVPADYAPLARWHYRAGAPATFAGVWRAVDGGGRVVGVLVVSRPTLNATWRERAWGATFASRRGKAALARRVNDEVRTISRVVVVPAWRGVGVARALVAAYLRRPLTRRTEVVAAMGRYCPLFVAAGMREVRTPPPRREREMRRALTRSGLKAWELLHLRRARAAARDPALRHAAERWARASKGTRGLIGDVPPAEVLAAAAGSLACRPMVFVFP